MGTKFLLCVIAVFCQALTQEQRWTGLKKHFRTLHSLANDTEECEWDREPCPCITERDDGDGETLELMDILTQGTELLKNYTYVSEAIIALGVTGAGKSTAVQIMAGNLSKLHAVVSTGGNLVIEDDDSMIGAGLNSKTYFPQLVQNQMNSSNILQFYDFPGFKDNRGAESDIAANFFMTEVSKLVGKVKLLFLVPYYAFDNRDGAGLETFSKSASMFVNDIGKFNKSIGLIANKADDRAAEVRIIDNIRIGLTNYREKLNNLSNEDPLKSKQISFIDIFLEQDQDGRHSQFWYIRTPGQCGSLNDSAEMHFTLNQLLDLCHRLEYTDVDAESFGFALDDSTKIEIEKKHSVAVNQAIANVTLNMTANLYSWYIDNKIRIQSFDLPDLAERVLNDSLQLEQFLNEANANPNNFANLILIYWETLGLEFPAHIKENLDLQFKFLEFFDKAVGGNQNQTRNVAMWTKDLVAFRGKLENLRTWFKFCAELDSILRQINIHWNRPALPSNPGNISWLQFIKEKNITTVSYEVEVAASAMESPEMHIIRDLLLFALRPPTVHCSSSSDPIIRVYGHFVLYTEIAEPINICDSGVKELHIYSAHSIFLDSDIDPNQSQIVMIAPYLIHNGNSQRRISLNGHEGGSIIPPMNSSGASGTENSGPEKGENGRAGNPGGPGGFFYGVALEVKLTSNTSQILIDTSGGRGGAGQTGGYGGAGFTVNANSCYQDRRFDPPESCNYNSSTDSMRCIHSGKDGQNGGSGGDGGKGGKGGLPGNSSLSIQSYESSKIVLEQNHGREGQKGLGGQGGSGSAAGRGYSCEGKSYTCTDKDPSGKKAGVQGPKGNDGGSDDAPSDPHQESKTIVESLARTHFRFKFASVSNSETLKFINYLSSLG